MSNLISKAGDAGLVRDFAGTQMQHFRFGTNAFGDVEVLFADVDQFIALARQEDEAASFENLVAPRERLRQFLNRDVSYVTWSLPFSPSSDSWVNLADWLREQAERPVPQIWWSDLD